MVIVASLIGVGGASVFIYRQMGNHLSLTKTPPAKETTLANGDTGNTVLPNLVPIQPTSEAHSATPTVADSTEWHFAEFSDQPRYIDVTYDGGRQHARLKVNMVLSSKPELANSSALVTDEAAPDESSPIDTDTPPGVPLSEGSRYIVDKDTGRIVGIDGTAGAALEVRRAQPVTSSLPATANTIRNPEPEVRVASPVLQLGRPLFDSDRPVQAAIPTQKFLPSRKAIPVTPEEVAEDADSTSATSAVAESAYADNSPAPRRAKATFREPSARELDEIFGQRARTSLFRRDRPVD